jgi:hypothetical protein
VTGTVRRRSPLEVRWRQLRNAPRPIVRAVTANLVVAGIGAAALLAADASQPRAPVSSGLHPVTFLAYVGFVCLAGSTLTYLWVPLPTGAGSARRRTPWAAMLGFLASVPLAYLALVVAFQLVRPLLV